MNSKTIVNAIMSFAIVLIFTVSFYSQPGVAGGTPGVLPGGLLQGTGPVQNPATPRENRFLLGQTLSTDARSRLKYGARYLLRLSAPYADPAGSGCNIELRAWVAAIEGDNGSQITVKTGPATPIRVCGNTPSVELINQTETNIQYNRLWIAELQRNPTRYTNAQWWINAYTQGIGSGQRYVAQGAP